MIEEVPSKTCSTQAVLEGETYERLVVARVESSTVDARLQDRLWEEEVNSEGVGSNFSWIARSEQLMIEVDKVARRTLSGVDLELVVSQLVRCREALTSKRCLVSVDDD